jgi:tetratricopeptide (TPR) repeat protein
VIYRYVWRSKVVVGDENMVWRSIVALVVAALLPGCAGVGVVETDDPYAKLTQARQLYAGSGRAAQARRQLDEAIGVFQAKGDDFGLGQAYREYGFMARMGAAEPGVVLIRVPNPGRWPTQADLELSNHYFQLSADAFAKLERSDRLANVYFNLGANYTGLSRDHGLADKKADACAYFDRALEASRQAETKYPGLVVELPRGARSFSEMTSNAKIQAGCV